MLTVGSLFSGIGGIDAAFEPAGAQTLWFSEIDKDACKVLAHHWPEVTNLGDISRIKWAAVDVPDVIVGGFPCQDLSVAGKRAGLAGERSGLWHEFHRALAELRPEWCLIENVPGLLSSNAGDDLRLILDALEELGYVIDVDILDAQYFGVPQRRRRVFITCQRSDSLLRQMTTTSALTIAQCLSENLHAVLGEARSPSRTGCKSWGFDAGSPADSLRRRMRLFGMEQDGAVQLLLRNLAVLQQSSAIAPDDSAFPPGKTSQVDLRTSGAIGYPRSDAETESFGGCLNTEGSWSFDLAGNLQTMSECITSTGESAITETKIFSCAQTLLSIAALITRSPHSCPTFWSAAQSTLIALEAYTDYARSTSNSLFTDVEWVQSWIDFDERASRLLLTLRCAGIRSWGSLLPLASCLSGNPPPSREAGERVAAGLTAGSATGSGVNQSKGDPSCLEGRGDSRGSGGREHSGPGLEVAYQCHGSNVGPMGTLRSHDSISQGVPFVAGTSGPLTRRQGNGPNTTVDDGALIASTLQGGGKRGWQVSAEAAAGGQLVAHPLTGEGFDASEDGSGRGVPLVAHSVAKNDHADESKSTYIPCGIGGSETGFALRANPSASGDKGDGGLNTSLVLSQPKVVAFNWQQGDDSKHTKDGRGRSWITRAGDYAAGLSRTRHDAVAGAFGVRRLTPLECSRLQGFPDDWLDGMGLSDSAKYRLLGNSVAVPVLEWIAQRMVAMADQQLEAVS